MRPVPPPLVASNVARALTRTQQEEEAAALEYQIRELQWELRQERKYYGLNRDEDTEEDAEDDGGDSEAQLSPDEAEASPEMAEPVVPPAAAKQEKQEQESDDDTWGTWGTSGRVATADPYV